MRLEGHVALITGVSHAGWVSLEHLIEAAIFLVSSAGDGVNGVVLPVQGKGI